MNEPVFRLEGVVKAREEMTDFEGPLTLILQLLSKNKIEIRDISISLILEQYLEYLDTMSELNLDIASEFVAMASHLAYIKTRMLLHDDDEISELEQLISSLERLQRVDIYEQIKSVSQEISQMYSRGASMIVGPPEYIQPEEVTYSHSQEDLSNAIWNLLNREDAIISSINPREAVYPMRIIYSIPEKISQVLDQLKAYGAIKVAMLFSASASRTELIATLIAVLELCRVGSVSLTGDDSDMTISYTGTGRDPTVIDFTEEEKNGY